jgi:predicted metal-dependent phosphoesterase TrpH
MLQFHAAAITAFCACTVQSVFARSKSTSSSKRAGAMRVVQQALERPIESKRGETGALLESIGQTEAFARFRKADNLDSFPPRSAVPRYDLHCHSTHSDGLLTPAAVVARAAARGVDVLALTDHDELSGLAEARCAASEAGIELVCGAELSVSWNDNTLHVVALGIDPKNPRLTEGLDAIRIGRSARARRIGDALAAAGIEGAYEGAMKYVTSERLVSRTHFARYLVEAGYARETKDVFKRYLTRGNPGYVAHPWATLSQAVGWIHAAGGQAVIAHPGRYKINATGMRGLLAEFRDIGGDAIEVLSPSHTPAQYTEFATYSRVFELRGSCGSDWHGPGESWMDFGDLPEMPTGVVPVWKDW